VERVGFSQAEMIGGGARALHAGGCSRVRAAVQSGTYKSTGWAWRLAAAVSSRVCTILTTTTVAVTARRPATTTTVAARNSHAHTLTHTHSRKRGRGERARQNSADNTRFTFVCNLPRARVWCVCCVDFLRARTLSDPAAAL